ncbi:MAG TPA: DUF1353 domain-containing protein [Hyphomicrobiaceae bacterium]|nr:DUF1353 domain-containing protein [Hyphomicrobiaceae bacterium]
MGMPQRFEIPREKGGDGKIRPRYAVNPATVTRFGGEEMWFVLHDPIGWRPNPAPEPQYAPVDVPAGFVTDLASIPWYLWSWLPHDGPYMHAAIIHDWLYWEQARSREEADNILWGDMTDLKVSYLKRQAIYQAVRLKGGSAWDENARLKAGGERRILARIPDNPVTTWAEWKQQPGVFA